MKHLSWIFVCVLVVGMIALSGCRRSKENQQENTNTTFSVPEEGYTGEDVTITFYHTMGPNLSAVLEQYMVEFNQLYPNIHVEHFSVGEYDDVREQINQEITAGNQPNIAYCYPDHVALYNLAKKVITLDFRKLKFLL